MPIPHAPRLHLTRLCLLLQAFLDGCFHRFCLLCISRWTDTQRAHPPAAGPAFTCPLCKAAYTSILHDWHHNSYK